MFQKKQPLLTVAEMAQYLHVPESTIRYWIFHRKLPYLKIGRAIRFNIEVVEAWLDAKALESKEPLQ